MRLPFSPAAFKVKIEINPELNPAPVFEIIPQIFRDPSSQADTSTKTPRTTSFSPSRHLSRFPSSDSPDVDEHSEQVPDIQQNNRELEQRYDPYNQNNQIGDGRHVQ
jgi:hypothetical protein